MPGQLLQIVSVLVALQHVTSDAPPWSPTSSAPSKLSATECDLRRARQWTPRAEYRGRGTLSAANALLNRHLTAHEGISLQPCETFDVSTLRELMLHLFSRASPYLSASYSASDGRHARYASVDEMEAEWSSVPVNDTLVRDAHCHEVVMWYVHHLTTPEQRALRGTHVLPLLPAAEQAVDRGTPKPSTAIDFYSRRVTCQDCHIGGMGPPSPDPDPPPIAPTSAKQRSRRCDTNYKEIFGVECGPCDGIDGMAEGDDDKYYHQTECHVVAMPSDVKPEDRVQVAFPERFVVDVIGSSDHFGGHDPTNPTSPRLYSQSHGRMYGDIRRGDSRLWLLRHETNFTSIVENGVPVDMPHTHAPPRTASIHAQTLRQRSLGVPGAQVTLVEGMPNASGMLTGCACRMDVVGVPALQSIDNLHYMGRIRLPHLEFRGGPVELDHWANWCVVSPHRPHVSPTPRRPAPAIC